MPGAIPHVLTGLSIFVIGTILYKNYFKKKNKIIEIFYLLFVCLFFSIIPDFFLIIYYSTSLLPKIIFEPYHIVFHFLLIPVSLIVLVHLHLKSNIKKKPLITIATICILTHIIIDIIAPEEINMWI